MTHRQRIGALFALLLALITATTHAQSDPIQYGAFASNTITEETPALFYDFEGNAGDLIYVDVFALDNALNPRVELLSAAQSRLALSTDDPFQPGASDARLTYLLPETGTYTILVQAENRTTGQFVMRVDTITRPDTEPLTTGVITTAALSPDLPTQAYTFDSAEANTVSASSAVTGFGFITEVRSPDGQTLAVNSGVLLRGTTTVVAPDSGTYTIIVSAAQANQSGNVDITLGELSAPAGDDSGEEMAAAEGETDTDASAEGDTTDDTDTQAEAPTPATETVEEAPAPEEGSDTETAAAEGEGEGDAETSAEGEGETTVGASGESGANVPENRCSVVPAGTAGVNVRAEASTDSGVIASIPAGEFRFADATDGAWIRLVGGGWVSSGVVELNGPCSGLTQVTAETTTTDATAAPAPTPQSEEVSPIGERNN